jgi:ABC-type nitrate/sulfonate/bicarbonate transport system ATPase subunit
MPDAGDEERRRHALRYLALVDMDESADARPRELSAGMCQRVALARAWALQPKMPLLDEPFSMLDSLTRVEMQILLFELNARDTRATLMVTHDVDEALFLSDRIALMTRGPAARVGELVTVPFARPRQRERVRTHPAHRPLRERLLSFLEHQDQKLVA